MQCNLEGGCNREFTAPCIIMASPNGILMLAQG